MAGFLRQLVHKYVPTQFHNPVGLFLRILRSGDRAALFAMGSAALGLVCTPLDLLMQVSERRRYRDATRPELPLIFVVGPPRSGTTLVAQVLIRHLPVCYINNLTAVFPRSPITSNVLFGRWMGSKKVGYTSYYGKSRHFSGPNDALYIWDRWLGKDRSLIPTTLVEAEKKDMVAFFAAFQEVFRRPLVNKVNRLVTCAHLVAEILENSYFLCLTRDPLWLGQSLLRARLEIHGDPTLAYGISKPDLPRPEKDEGIHDVCEQVRFYEKTIEEQQRIIGRERFWIVPYESFCRSPEALVGEVSGRILGDPVDLETLRTDLRPFQVSSTVKVDRESFARLTKALARSGTE
jgi:hypothetical protein